jgi:hypothetical protein
MSHPSKDHSPVELSHEYILRCITDRKLGAFGDVFFAEDSHFVVKKIKLAQSDQDALDEIQKSLQRELSGRSVFCVLSGVWSYNDNPKQ